MGGEHNERTKDKENTRKSLMIVWNLSKSSGLPEIWGDLVAEATAKGSAG